jgi:hypothetical protein
VGRADAAPWLCFRSRSLGLSGGLLGAARAQAGYLTSSQCRRRLQSPGRQAARRQSRTRDKA